MSKKSIESLLEVPQSEADLAKIQASVDRVSVATIPVGSVEPPVIGDTILVKNVDETGKTWPAMVVSVNEEGAMILEVHAISTQTKRKLPNGQTVNFEVAVPHTFVIQTDDTGNLTPPAAWFPRK